VAPADIEIEANGDSWSTYARVSFPGYVSDIEDVIAIAYWSYNTVYYIIKNSN
jgi:hypothetical protein